MKKSLQMGSAFIGIVVGAGFASGQEILQYFTSFGYMGLVGALISAALFGYLGMNLTRLGSRMQTTSHKEVVYGISGKFIGRIVDSIIILTLFGVGVVMIAGAGSIFSQQFGLSSTLGSTVMVVAVIITIMLNVQKVIAIIAGMTPFLVLAVVLIAVYSIITMDMTFNELNLLANDQPTSLPNWFISSINYVSFNIAVGASMAIVMGGTEKDEKIAARGGLFGGLGLGILITLSYLAIFAKIDVVAGFDMPMLKIADDIHPILGLFMSLILFAMIYNTAVGMFFSFSARFVKMGTAKFRIFVIVTGIIAYLASFVGFTKLVSMFYPVVGYLGLFLVGAIIFASFKTPPVKNKSK
ncbi:YkvI family membrane protein [Paenisporosarcina antarctica]|uniref:Membrane protein YkvI n=1 Tax=Paenisporosarcina antarctica TaxID=417367 RepID=A0A4V1AND3_9BACL|nr:hypothetical protein [Paenisporosarcina antarctica]QBP42375.1 hypothetical protein E2636_14965 [Paenisporosarcina antarctica]